VQNDHALLLCVVFEMMKRRQPYQLNRIIHIALQRVHCWHTLVDHQTVHELRSHGADVSPIFDCMRSFSGFSKKPFSCPKDSESSLFTDEPLGGADPHWPGMPAPFGCAHGRHAAGAVWYTQAC
jgi:hypothetical protein